MSTVSALAGLPHDVRITTNRVQTRLAECCLGRGCSGCGGVDEFGAQARQRGDAWRCGMFLRHAAEHGGAGVCVNRDIVEPVGSVSCRVGGWWWR